MSACLYDPIATYARKEEESKTVIMSLSTIELLGTVQYNICLTLTTVGPTEILPIILATLASAT